MPSLIILSGPNGSGKSTMYNALIEKVPSFKEIPFINPDEVAKELHGSYIVGSSTEDNNLMLQAGREAVKRRKALLSEGISFGFETTLSGNSEIRLIKEAHLLGYSVNLIFIGLVNPNFNVMRVAMRVAAGGHSVDSEMIVRRYQRSMDNAIKVFPFVKRFYVFDNSTMHMEIVASSKTTFVKDRALRGVRIYKESNKNWYANIISHLKEKHEEDTSVDIKYCLAKTRQRLGRVK